MKITKDFFKHVPREKQQAVLDRLQSFSEQIIAANVFHSIPKGFWIRKVAGTNIYKFRVNIGDRILFTFNDDRTVTFLSFETHDNQIRAAKNVTAFQQVTDFQIYLGQYENDMVDEAIDDYVKYELASKLMQIEQDEVLEDEYISLVIEDEQLRKQQAVFTREQFECLNVLADNTIILGCAGSGKTNIALRKIAMLAPYEPTDYVTHSQYLMNDVKQYYKANTSDHQVRFYSLAAYFAEALQQSYIVIYEEDFYRWYKTSNFHQLTSLLPEEVHAEIYSVIKGSMVEKIASEQQYMQRKSNLTTALKREIYFIACQYERWLSQNKYVDLNDLAYFVLERKVTIKRYLIVDEIQELTLKQLTALLQLLAQRKALFLGDTEQALTNHLFTTDSVTTQLTNNNKHFVLRQMNKNFRSGDQIIDVLNNVKTLIPQPSIAHEIAVRQSDKPKLFVGSLDETMFETISNDPEAIIIVPTFEDKEQFLSLGIQRVFTVKEVQGLQYKRVYCYNLLRFVSDSQMRSTPFHHLFFHSLYVAASRAVFELVFIEEEYNTQLLKPELLMPTQTLQSLDQTVQHLEQWLEEGQKLERLGKFVQAIDAYKKANDSKAVERCKAMVDRQLNYNHTQNYRTVIKFDFVVDCAEKIEQVLQQFAQLGVQLKGATQSFHRLENGRIEFENLYISSTMKAAQISDKLFALHNLSDVNRQSLVLCGVLYEQDEPISIATKWNLQNAYDYGLCCTFTADGTVQIEPRHMPAESNLVRLKKSIYEKDPLFNGLYEKTKLIQLIETSQKNQSADDILDDIFS
ncbi:AAA family ATPase [Solibacillus sp. FSL W8-0474]|uniref:AAA family ATPase n=1 Tax=Solibacillus sp. FSL W8-0474 TaxID=2975336 RepID=UPI0030F9C0D8